MELSKNPMFGRKGDKCPGYKGKFIRLYHKDTNEIVEGYGIKAVADKIGVTSQCLNRVIYGKRNHHKGWMLCPKK
ncbi:MAG: hypothetical protein MN733_40825 [Nitrososphaera sp.]|nr:hypothetical protein [Nitrososphaera sp.]